MASKIRFRLYRIDSPISQKSEQALSAEANASISIGEWQYIIGKTEADIDIGKPTAAGTTQVGTISLTPENFSNDVSAEELITPISVFAIKNDELNITRLTVNIGGEIFYIRRTQVEDVFTDAIPRVFDFYVNPQRITFNKQKLITEVRTRGGWDIQHWGEQLTEITVEGITGGLHRDITKAISPGDIGETLGKEDDISKSSAWKSLRILRSIYEADHGHTRSKQSYKLGFSVFEDFYIGYFQNFQGPEIVVDKPYIMTYSFIFKVEETLSDNPLRLEFERSNSR